MPVMSVQTIDFSTPTAISFSDAAADDAVPVASGERVFLFIVNQSAVATDVTIVSQVATANVPGVGAVAIGDRVFNVPSQNSRLIGPIPKGFVNTATGRANITYSQMTNVRRAALVLPLPA